ncbi:helix-turn-helix domain-containing protein [Pediococcus stilesii]|nr:helix-turn-helix transcriptional regulator [Pediococcus stilesii]
MKASVSTILRYGVKKIGLSQKEIGGQTNISRGTISNYLTDNYRVPSDEVLALVNAIDDDETRFNVACILLGTLPMFNGDKIRDSPDSYANFMEDEEFEERTYLKVNHIKSKLSSQYLSKADKADVRRWSEELLDEILMEFGVLMRAARVSGTSINQLIHDRMPMYIEKNYMKGSKDYAQGRTRNY